MARDAAPKGTGAGIDSPAEWAGAKAGAGTGAWPDTGPAEPGFTCKKSVCPR